MSDLGQHPPPRKGAKPGYYPDPLGTGRARWWDGKAWTMRVGPIIPAGAPKGKPVEAPAKLCRHCGAQSETFGERCPNCGRSYGTSGWVIAAAIAAACVAIILLLGGCAVLIGLAVDEAEDEIDESAITRAEFDSIQRGSTEASVRLRLGGPLSEETYTKPAVNCLYYAQEDEGVFGIDDYEFCFKGGLLYSKRVDD